MGALHAVDSARFPATAAVADAVPVPLADEFAFGLNLILWRAQPAARQRSTLSAADELEATTIGCARVGTVTTGRSMWRWCS
jgi:hypothetical protein